MSTAHFPSGLCEPVCTIEVELSNGKFLLWNMVLQVWLSSRQSFIAAIVLLTSDALLTNDGRKNRNPLIYEYDPSEAVPLFSVILEKSFWGGMGERK